MVWGCFRHHLWDLVCITSWALQFSNNVMSPDVGNFLEWQTFLKLSAVHPWKTLLIKISNYIQIEGHALFSVMRKDRKDMIPMVWCHVLLLSKLPAVEEVKMWQDTKIKDVFQKGILDFHILVLKEKKKIICGLYMVIRIWILIT